jgi:hypothetical protein
MDMELDLYIKERCFHFFFMVGLIEKSPLSLVENLVGGIQGESICEASIVLLFFPG